MSTVVEFQQVRFTKDQPVILKSGKPSIETVKLYWAVCDVCGEGTWTNNFTRDPCANCGAKRCNRKARCCDGCRHPVGLRCRMTAHCPGKHRKAE